MLIPLGILDYPAPTAAGSYDLLETEILTGTQASVTFSSLNSTYGADYQHLQIRYTTRSTRAADDSYIKVTFNGSATGYYGHLLYGDGSGSPASLYWGTSTFLYAGWGAGNNAASSSFGAGVMDILDAFSTTKRKTMRDLSGRTSPTRIGLGSGSWASNDALTSITLTADNNDWAIGCRFSLYGLKAA